MKFDIMSDQIWNLANIQDAKIPLYPSLDPKLNTIKCLSSLKSLPNPSIPTKYCIIKLQ